MNRLKVILIATLILVFFIKIACAEEPSLSIVRLQPFTADFQVNKYNPTGASKTNYYIYRQEGTAIDVSTANLISQLTLPSSVNFNWSNTNLEPSYPIREGVQYTYIVKAEAVDEKGNILGTILTNPVSVSVPKSNVNLKITGTNGEVLANTPIEIRKGDYIEYAMTDSSGTISGFALTDGQYAIIIRAQESETIIKNGTLEIKNSQPVSNEIRVQNVIDNGTSNSSSTASDSTKGTLNNSSISINLKIGQKEASINDKKIKMDASPYIKNKRTMVPIRLIAGDALGAEIKWDDKARTITIKYNDKTILLEIGKQTAFINSNKVLLDAPPEIKNGRTMVPIRFIAENFGFTITWNGTTQSVTLTKS